MLRYARIALGALALLAPLALAACDKPASTPPEVVGLALPDGTPGRRIEVAVNADGYVPATIEAKAGEDLVLRFTRTIKSECLGAVVFPNLKIKKELPMGTPVEIAVKADRAGTIPFECGMAMVHGSVHVTGS